MIWWILLAGLIFGLLVLGLAVWPLLRRLPALRRALKRLSDRASEAQQLQSSASALEERVTALAEGAAQAQHRIAASRQPGR